MNVGSLFSGIGGFDLGLERAGMRTVWFCENDPYCQRVLARHWPGVPCYPDVRTLVADTNSEPAGGTAVPRPELSDRRGFLPVPVPHVDVLCGGFPCQDLSYAGRGAGITGTRSGLWTHYARLISELRPRYVLVENVPALLTRGLGTLLGDLAALGYDAEWDCIPASAVGAPHRRDRVWVVAYPNSEGEPGGPVDAQPGCRLVVPGGTLADPEHIGRIGRPDEPGRPQSARPPGQPQGSGLDRTSRRWRTEPDMGRVAHGIPARVDRLRALGNALVPQIAELIGRQVMTWEETHP